MPPAFGYTAFKVRRSRTRAPQGTKLVKRQFVEPVVHAVGDASDAERYAARQVREERQREKAVRHRAAPLPRSALPINVDQLVVPGEPREIINVTLLDGHPVACTNFLPHVTVQLVHRDDRKVPGCIHIGAQSLIPAAFTTGVHRLISRRKCVVNSSGVLARML